MRSALSRLRLHRPTSLTEALTLLARRRQRRLRPLAGGTDIYVALNDGHLPDTEFLDLWALPELRGIERLPGGGLRIGAGTTFSEILSSALVRRQLPMLISAGRQIGGVQIQNRATLGGNVVNASPAADAVPVLQAADATLVLASTRGERRVAAADFYTGYRQTVLAPNELVTAVEIPALRGRGWFRKVGTRAANAISKVVMAGVGDRRRPRVAIGSVGPTVTRLPRTEQALAAGASAARAVAVLRSEISPIDDLRSSASYRARVAEALLEQFWEETSP